MSEANGCAELRIEYKPIGWNGSATLTARLGDDILAHAKVDLAKPKARTEFVKSLTKGRPGISAAAVEAELLRIGAELTVPPIAEEKPPQPDSQELLMRMPQSVRDEARTMLESPDLLQRMIDDVAALGVAGERQLVATIILVGVSRLLPRPLAAIVQAPSSTGKSYVVEKVATIFPPEAVIHATSMTAQSLYYLQPGSLQHKWIVAGERSRKEDDDTAEATRALREMIGSGKLTKLVPMKEGGKIVTQRIEQPGPVAYIETTTLSKIFDEDANRCLLLTADERTAQTKAILDRLAARYSGAAKDGGDAIIARHHALQRMIQQRPVAVPFAEQLAARFPDERIEARRAYPHLMGMIQASAQLHQYQRKIDADGRIVADADDYQLARFLCSGPLARLLGGRISDAAIRFYDRLVAWAPDKFTTTEAAKQDRKSNQAVRAWLIELCDAGGVEQVEESRGNRPATWRLTGVDRSTLDKGDGGLPTVEEVTK